MANLWRKFRCSVLGWHRPALPAVRDGIDDHTHCEDCGVALVGNGGVWFRNGNSKGRNDE